MTRTRYIPHVFFLLGVFFCFPVFASVSQTEFGTTQSYSHASSYWTYTQQLATSTSGTVLGVQYKTKVTDALAGTVSVRIYDCGADFCSYDDISGGSTTYYEPYTSAACSSVYYQSYATNTVNTTNIAAQYWKDNLGGGCESLVLSASKIYAIDIMTPRTNLHNNSGGATILYGAGTDVIGGDCFRTGAGVGVRTSCGSVKDLYFVLSTTAGVYSSNRIDSIISPTNLSTTADTYPLFSYNYFTSSAYNRASILLKDLTTGQTINTNGASTTISNSGSHTYAEYF